MNAANENRNNRRLFAFWQRGQQWLEINGYHVGDIHAEDPVLIQPGATVVGNVIAPKITIAGLLHGSLMARETAVAATGQVWGDVYTVTLDITAGGKIQGWITTLEENSFPMLHAEGQIPTASPLALQHALPEEVLELPPRPSSSDQIYALRYLQSEAATAMAARAELEQTFEKRLSEVSGESTVRIRSLHEELDAARAELNELRLRLNDTEETLHLREARIERQSHEISTTRVLLTERNRELGELRQATAVQTQTNDALRALRVELEQALYSTRQELKTAHSRITNLEVALQASLTHTSDQEESLIRWQELAEVTQKRVARLESDLDTARFQLHESTQVTERLREQRLQLEDEWQKTLDELAELQQEIRDGIPGSDSAGHKKMLAAEESAQEYKEQVVWAQTNLKATRLELDHTRQIATHLEQELTELQTILLTNRSQHEAERLQLEERLTEHIKQMALLESKQQRLQLENDQLKIALRELDEKLQTNDATLDDYYQQVQGQGQQLAESRAALVDKDLQIGTQRETAVQYANALKLIKQRATDHINGLNDKLAQTQQQLHDMQQVLERRERRPKV